MKVIMQTWGEVIAAVGEGLDTQSLFSAVNNARVDAGLAAGGFNIQDMNAMRSLAATQRNADNAVAASGNRGTITSDMVGVAPWSNPLQIRSLAQQYEVRFEHNVTVDGEPQTFWRTVTIDGQLPDDLSSLYDQLGQDGNDLADSYGQTHVGVGAVSITAI